MKRFLNFTFRCFQWALLIACVVGVQPSGAQAQADALASADAALFNGDYSTAVAQYTAAIGDPNSKCAAIYGLGVTQFRAEHYQEAADAFAQDPTACPLSFEAHIMRAQALQLLGRGNDSVADYQQALAQKPGLLDSYLYEQLATLAPDQSVYLLRLATEAQRQPEGKFALREKLAQVYELVGSPATALSEYNTLLQEISDYLATLSHVEGAEYDKDGSIRARIELAAGTIEIENGQPDAGYARLQRIITNYWQSSSALSALIDLVQAGQSVDVLQRMRINVRNQNYGPVISVLTDYLNTPQSAQSAPAELYLLLGQAQRGMGDANGALSTFAQLRQKFPNDPMASSAALEQANTYAQAGAYDQAVTAYTQVASAYPQSPEAPKALLSAAETESSHGNQSSALDLYDQLGKQYPTSDQAKTGLLEAGMLLRSSDPTRAADFFSRIGSAEGFVWQGKVLDQAGSSDAAKQAWTQAKAAEPGSFFSIRACELLNGQTPFTVAPLANTSNAVSDADKAAAAQWVSQTFNIPSVSADLSSDLANDPMLQRGTELWAVGEWSDARAEFDALHKLHRDDPVALLQLAYYYQSIKVYRSSLNAATRLIYASNQPLLNIPDAVLRLAFPLDYADLIIPQSQDDNLDPLLVAALIRQESSFDPTVDSIADARGLMQFVPSTAQDVANQLAWPNYKVDDLYRPIVSVAFGTHYLGAMRDYQNGSSAGALLSYNAGPGAARTWLSQAGNDLELLYEVIGYPETQSYLDIIYANHYIYQHLYGSGAPDCRPS